MKRRTWIAALTATATSAAAFFLACVGDDPVSSTPSGVDGGNDTANGGDTSTTNPGDDGGVEAAQPNEAGVDSSCANEFAGADFCDDFDNGGYQPGWVAPDSGTNGVIISVVSNPTVSAPHALSVSTAVLVPDGGYPTSYLFTTKPTAGATEFMLEAQLRQLAATPDFNALSSPFSMILNVGPTAYIHLRIRPNTGVAVCSTDGKVLGADGGAGGTLGDMPFAYGVWHHVTLKAVIASAGSVVNLSCEIDGVTKSDPAKTAVVDGTAAAQIGLAAPPGQGPITYFYDNVVFDLK